MPNTIGQSPPSSDLSDFVADRLGDDTQAEIAALTKQYLLDDAASLLKRMTHLKGGIDGQKEPEKRARAEEIEKKAVLLYAKLNERLEANGTNVDAPSELREFEGLLNEVQACSSGKSSTAIPTHFTQTTSTLRRSGLSGRVLQVVESTLDYGSGSSVVRHQIRSQPAAVVNGRQVGEAGPTNAVPMPPRESDFDVVAAEVEFKRIVQSNPYDSDHADHRSLAETMERLQSQWASADGAGKKQLLATATNAYNYARRNAAAL